MLFTGYNTMQHSGKYGDFDTKQCWVSSKINRVFCTISCAFSHCLICVAQNCAFIRSRDDFWHNIAQVKVILFYRECLNDNYFCQWLFLQVFTDKSTNSQVQAKSLLVGFKLLFWSEPKSWIFTFMSQKLNFHWYEPKSLIFTHLSQKIEFSLIWAKNPAEPLSSFETELRPQHSLLIILPKNIHC